MYERMAEVGITANRIVGSTTVEKVVEAVLEAIRHDLPEVVETGAPIRPVLAVAQLAPRSAERVVSRIGLDTLFRRAAEHRGRTDS
jgi:hypothetical protein